MNIERKIEALQVSKKTKKFLKDAFERLNQGLKVYLQDYKFSKKDKATLKQNSLLRLSPDETGKTRLKFNTASDFPPKILYPNEGYYRANFFRRKKK